MHSWSFHPWIEVARDFLMVFPCNGIQLKIHVSLAGLSAVCYRVGTAVWYRVGSMLQSRYYATESVVCYRVCSVVCYRVCCMLQRRHLHCCQEPQRISNNGAPLRTWCNIRWSGMSFDLKFSCKSNPSLKRLSLKRDLVRQSYICHFS